MTTLQFSCLLKEDVVLTMQKPQQNFYPTLSFIPGRCFRGIVARDDDGYKLLAGVRFGDAHPSYRSQNVVYRSKNVVQRTLHIPASMFYPKHSSPEECCYLHHWLDHTQMAGTQLKQCRHGYFAFVYGGSVYGGSAIGVLSPRNYATKRRISKPKMESTKLRISNPQMEEFYYESLQRGSEFFFEVEVDNDGNAKAVSDKLTGLHRIGRSRNAQYGLVEISEAKFGQNESRPKMNKADFVTVYADGRLVFIDDNTLQCTFRPTAEQLGVKDGTIDWSRTQVRTFCYTPWSNKREAFGADRTGFEKGSVFVVRLPEGMDRLSKPPTYIGSYNAEGFGRVIYNPDFLEMETGTNGETAYGIQEARSARRTVWSLIPTTDSPALIKYVALRQQRESDDQFIYSKVNEFVKKYAKDDYNPSIITPRRWAALRSKIRMSTNSEQVMDSLKYLEKKSEWKDHNRYKHLTEFMETFCKEKHRNLVRQGLYYLASTMIIQGGKDKSSNNGVS